MNKNKKFRNILLGSLLSFVLSIPSKASVYEIEYVNPLTHAKMYNQLQSIELADEQIKKLPDFSSFLEAAGKVIEKHGLTDCIGLRLIHNHFILNDGQVMVENFEEVDSVPSLVTSACSVSEAKGKGAIPASWLFSTFPPSSFELSTDPAVLKIVKSLEQEPAFLVDMKEVIENYRLQNLMAVAVLKKDFLMAKDKELYLEISDDSLSRSIVQLVKEEDVGLSVITAWKFFSLPGGGVNVREFAACQRLNNGHRRS